MITVLKSGTTVEQRDNLIEWFEDQGLKVHVSVGDTYTILGLVGDTSHIDVDMVNMLDIVDSVKRVSEPFKKANRKFHPEDTVIDVNGVKIGGGHFVTIAGPCSVENEEQIVEVAKRVKAAGADMLRGGAFKPRTSPYAFQGLKAEGIELLLEAKKVTGLPIVTEIMNEAYLDLYEDVDVIQVGARNMQNFDLLKALGEIDKPILLKRGLANSRMKDYYDLWMLSRDVSIDADTASRAIERTFKRRKTDMPTNVPDGLLDEFAHNEVKVVQWNAFVRKNRISPANVDFPSIVSGVREFLMRLVRT